MNNKTINRESAGSFLVRWLSCSLGLWVAVRLFGAENNVDTWAQTVFTYLVAGLIFSAANAVLRSAIVTLSLPFIFITLGLFMLVVNGFMVWLAIMIAPNLKMDFGGAIISSFIISLVNYLVSGIIGFNKRDKIVKGGDEV